MAALALVAAGCSSTPPRPSPRDNAPPTVDPRSPTSTSSPATARCGLPAAPSKAVAVRTADQLTLPAYETGSGPRGVVLVHESGSPALCDWWPYAAHLAARGYHVLIFDLRCYGMAPCPAGKAGSRFTTDVAAAVATLRVHGAHEVVLAGASLGGSVVLASAVHPPAGVTAIASLSGDLFDESMDGGTPPLTNHSSATHIRLPVLFALAEQDVLVSVTETRALVARIPSTNKTLLVLPASTGHGSDMLVGQTPGTWSSFDATLQEFLAAHT